MSGIAAIAWTAGRRKLKQASHPSETLIGPSTYLPTSP